MTKYGNFLPRQPTSILNERKEMAANDETYFEAVLEDLHRGRLTEDNICEVSTTIQSSWSNPKYCPSFAEVTCAAALATAGHLESVQWMRLKNMEIPNCDNVDITKLAKTVVGGVYLDKVTGDTTQLFKSICSKGLSISNMDLGQEETLSVVQCLQLNVEVLYVGSSDVPAMLDFETLKKYDGTGKCHKAVCHSGTKDTPRYVEFIKELETWSTEIVKWDVETSHHSVTFKRPIQSSPSIESLHIQRFEEEDFKIKADELEASLKDPNHGMTNHDFESLVTKVKEGIDILVTAIASSSDILISWREALLRCANMLVELAEDVKIKLAHFVHITWSQADFIPRRVDFASVTALVVKGEKLQADVVQKVVKAFGSNGDQHTSLSPEEWGCAAALVATPDAGLATIVRKKISEIQANQDTNQERKQQNNVNLDLSEVDTHEILREGPRLTQNVHGHDHKFAGGNIIHGHVTNNFFAEPQPFTSPTSSAPPPPSFTSSTDPASSSLRSTDPLLPASDFSTTPDSSVNPSTPFSSPTNTLKSFDMSPKMTIGTDVTYLQLAKKLIPRKTEVNDSKSLSSSTSDCCCQIC